MVKFPWTKKVSITPTQEEIEELTDEILDDLLDEWGDEELLNNFAKFLDRVEVTSKFIEDEDGLITHQLLAIQAGDFTLLSDPNQLEWPLQALPMPDAFKGKLN